MAKSVLGVNGFTKQEVLNLCLKGVGGWFFQTEGTTWAILGCLECPGGWGGGWQEMRLERGVERSLRWPYVPTRDCRGRLAVSFELTLDSGVHLLMYKPSFSEQRLSGLCWREWLWLTLPLQLFSNLLRLSVGDWTDVTLDSWLWLFVYISGCSFRLCTRCTLEELKLKVPVWCWYVSLPSLVLSLQWGEVTDPPLLRLYMGYVKTVTPGEKLRLSQLGLLLF